jgi:hypothetical protein
VPLWSQSFLLEEGFAGGSGAGGVAGFWLGAPARMAGPREWGENGLFRGWFLGLDGGDEFERFADAIWDLAGVRGVGWGEGADPRVVSFAADEAAFDAWGV